MQRAVYPGTFDPMTAGHMDIIKRSLKIIKAIENKFHLYKRIQTWRCDRITKQSK